MNICYLFNNNKKLPKKNIFFQILFIFFFNQMLHFNKANTTKISSLPSKAQTQHKVAFC